MTTTKNANAPAATAHIAAANRLRTAAQQVEYCIGQFVRLRERAARGQLDPSAIPELGAEMGQACAALDAILSAIASGPEQLRASQSLIANLLQASGTPGEKTHSLTALGAVTEAFAAL